VQANLDLMHLEENDPRYPKNRFFGHLFLYSFLGINKIIDPNDNTTLIKLTDIIQDENQLKI
jgi:hypothetical protein